MGGGRKHLIHGKKKRSADYFPRNVKGTDRLDRSTQRLKASQALAAETEAIGASTLADLHRQREVIEHTTTILYESEGYVDRSVKTLKGMARRYHPPLLSRCET